MVGCPDARLRFKSLYKGTHGWGWAGEPLRTPGVAPPPLLCFVAVQVFEGFELLDERLVLVLQHGHAVLQTLDVLLLLPATFPCRLPVERQGQRQVSDRSPENPHSAGVPDRQLTFNFELYL